MSIIEQTIGIAIISICFAVGLIYVAPIVIKDSIEIIKETFFEKNVAVSNKSE